MRRFEWLVAGAVLGITLLAAAGRSPAAETQGVAPGRQEAQKLDRSIKVTLGYLLYLPKDYAQKDSWPLMLFLHGAGERGNDLQRVKLHGPPKLIAADKEFPFIVVSPQCPKDRWWEPFELTALLDEIVERHKVDQDRIYVTGLSMGGFGTWSLAAYTPDRFAALVPICGGGEAYAAKRSAIDELLSPAAPPGEREEARARVRQGEARMEKLRKETGALESARLPGTDPKDSDLVFLRFVLDHFPRGLVGLVDISARKYLGARGRNALTFTVPYRRLLQMEGFVEGSFLEGDTWKALVG